MTMEEIDWKDPPKKLRVTRGWRTGKYGKAEVDTLVFDDSKVGSQPRSMNPSALELFASGPEEVGVLDRDDNRVVYTRVKDGGEYIDGHTQKGSASVRHISYELSSK